MSPRTWAGIAALMPERWQTLATSGQMNTALSEMNEYVASGIDATEKLSVAYLRHSFAFNIRRRTLRPVLP